MHIVITGASSGIGAALARHYAAKGFGLSLSGRDEGRLADVTKTLIGARDINTRIIDVRDAEAMQDWLMERQSAAPVDLVIANAGISAGTGGDTQGENKKQAEDIFAVNWQGVLNTIHPLIPAMITRGEGQIALMSSLAGYRGWPGAPAYCASKAAVKIYGESLRGALKPAGIKVNVICPGFVESAMTAKNDFAMPFKMSAERAASLIARGLEQNRGRISFPWQSAMMAYGFAALPDSWSQRILCTMPAKQSTTK